MIDELPKALTEDEVAEVERALDELDLDPDDVAWVEETRWNLSDRTAQVSFLPDQAAGLLRAAAAGGRGAGAGAAGAAAAGAAAGCGMASSPDDFFSRTAWIAFAAIASRSSGSF